MAINAIDGNAAPITLKSEVDGADQVPVQALASADRARIDALLAAIQRLQPAGQAASGSVAVGASAAVVRPSRPTRRYLRIENRGAEPVAVGLASNTDLGSNNVAVLAQGDQWDTAHFTGDVYAVAGSATSVTVEEIYS